MEETRSQQHDTSKSTAGSKQKTANSDEENPVTISEANNEPAYKNGAELVDGLSNLADASEQHASQAHGLVLKPLLPGLPLHTAVAVTIPNGVAPPNRVTLPSGISFPLGVASPTGLHLPAGRTPPPGLPSKQQELPILNGMLPKDTNPSESPLMTNGEYLSLLRAQPQRSTPLEEFEHDKIIQDLNALGRILEEYQALKCAACQTLLFQQIDVVRHVSKWLFNLDIHENGPVTSCTDIHITLPLNVFPCPNSWCGMRICSDCRQVVVVSASTSAGGEHHHFDTNSNRSAALLSLWMLLVYFESSESYFRAPLPKSAKRKRVISAQAMEDLAKSPAFEWQESRNRSRCLIEAFLETRDKRNTTLLRLLTGIVLSIQWNAKSKTDTGATSSMDLVPLVFRFSTLPMYLKELCQNLSARDLSDKPKLYTAAFGLLHALHDQKATRFLIVEPLRLKVDHCSLVSLSLEGSKSMLFDRLAFSVEPSLMKCLGDFTGVATSLAEIQQQLPETYKKSEGRHITNLLAQIEKFATGLGLVCDANTERVENQPPDKAAIGNEQVEFIEDGKLTAQFAFNNWPCASQVPQPGRMRKLMHDIGLLRTSLPKGIFVKIAASRPDMMKALIVGPADTPYANGLFEFDIYCGNGYPQEPPSVHCTTASVLNGKFNPNIHDDGGVCLSLLGTWPGDPSESWQPGLSSILQVLISIQSQILVKNPLPDDRIEMAQRYSVAVQLEKMRTAILAWFQNSAFQDSIWNSIVYEHFSLCASIVLAEANELQAKGGSKKIKADFRGKLETVLSQFISAPATSTTE